MVNSLVGRLFVVKIPRFRVTICTMKDKLKSIGTALLSHLQAFCAKSFSGKVVLVVGVAAFLIGAFLF